MSILIQNSTNYTPNIPDSKHVVLYVNVDGNTCVLNSQNHITNLSELNGDYYKKPIDEVITYPISSLNISILTVGYRVIVENSGIIYEVCQDENGNKFWSLDNHHMIGAMVFVRNTAILNKYYYVYDGKQWNRTNYSNNNSHITDHNNPHRVTKEQIGLGNVKNVTLIPVSQFEEHIINSNPHRVTKEQIGLSNVENVILVPATALLEHIESINPHQVTKEQIGLGNVENEPQVNVREYKEHINDYNNPHGWTKEDFGLGNIDNKEIYPKSKFNEHVNARNPHQVTKEQLGLGNVENIEHVTETEFNEHVNAHNPHQVTKEQLGLESIENISQVSVEEFNDHITTINPHNVTKEDVGLGMIPNEHLLGVTEFDTHVTDHNNPHHVTKEDVGLGMIVNIRQLSRQTFDAHASDHNNPHRVSLRDIGLGNIVNEPSISKETWNNGQHTHRMSAADVGLELVVNTELIEESVLVEHLNARNPHQVTKEQLGLGNVDNTSDVSKPISINQQVEIDKKSDVYIEVFDLVNNTETIVNLYDEKGNLNPEIIVPTTDDVVVPIGCFRKQDDQFEPTLQLFSPIDNYYKDQFINIHTIPDLLSAVDNGLIKIKGLSTLIIHIEGDELEYIRLFDGDRIIIYVNDYYKRTVTYGIYHNHQLPEGDELIDRIRELTTDYTGTSLMKFSESGLINVSPLSVDYYSINRTQYKGEVYGIPFIDQLEIQYKNNFRKVLGYPLKTTMIQQSPIIGLDVLQMGDGAEVTAEPLTYLQNRNGTFNVQHSGYNFWYNQKNVLRIMEIHNSNNSDYVAIIFNGESANYENIINSFIKYNTEYTRDQKFKCIDVLFPVTDGITTIYSIHIISTSLIDNTDNNTAVAVGDTATEYYVKSTVENKLVKIWSDFNFNIDFGYELVDTIPDLIFDTTIEKELNKLKPSVRYKFIENKTDDELKSIVNNPFNSILNEYDVIQTKSTVYCLTDQSLTKYENLNNQHISNVVNANSKINLLLINNRITLELLYNGSKWNVVLYNYQYINPSQPDNYNFGYYSDSHISSIYNSKNKIINCYLSYLGLSIGDISPNIGNIPSPINPYVGHTLLLNSNNLWYHMLYFSNKSNSMIKNGSTNTDINSTLAINGKFHPFNNDQHIVGYVMISSGIVLLLNDGSVWKGELNYKGLPGEEHVRPLIFTKILNESNKFIAIHSMFNHNILLIDSHNNLTILNPYTLSSHIIEQNVIESNQSIIACNSFAYFSVIVTTNIKSDSNVISVYYFDHYSKTINYTGISDWLTDDLSTIRIRMTNGSKTKLENNQLAGNYISIHGSDNGILIPWNPYSTYTLNPNDANQKLYAAINSTYGRPMYNTTSRYCNLFADNNINRINLENDNIYYKYKN